MAIFINVLAGPVFLVKLHSAMHGKKYDKAQLNKLFLVSAKVLGTFFFYKQTIPVEVSQRNVAKYQQNALRYCNVVLNFDIALRKLSCQELFMLDSCGESSYQVIKARVAIGLVYIS